MNVTPIAQQQTYTDKTTNQSQSPTTKFQDELNKHQGGKWKNRYIDGLSPSQNQALNNKLEEMGITSEEEIYQVKAKILRSMNSYESLGVTDPSIYLKSHAKSLEYTQSNGGLSDTNKNVLEVLYAIQEDDLKNLNVENELDKHQGGKWKNHFIEGLSKSQNQALNNKLEEMGITSDEEIYQIKSNIEGQMIIYESLGVTNPSIYLKSHAKSLEYTQSNGGLSDTNKNVLEVLYAIQEDDLKNESIGSESNKYLSNAMNKFLYDEKNKTISQDNSIQANKRHQNNEYVSFQKEIEHSNRDIVLSLSI